VVTGDEPHPPVELGAVAAGVSVAMLAGLATRVPQAAVTSGIQRSTTVILLGPLRWARVSDLGSQSSPKLHGMQEVTSPAGRPEPVGSRPLNMRRAQGGAARARPWPSDWPERLRGKDCPMCDQGRPDEDEYLWRFHYS
jgi:hypothetical protein